MIVRKWGTVYAKFIDSIRLEVFLALNIQTTQGV